MNKYEIMFIVKATLDEGEIKNVVKRFEKTLTTNGAKIIDQKDMGQKELAYEIKKCKNGHYFLLTLESNDDKATNEFNRLALISQEIIRHLITKIEE